MKDLKLQIMVEDDSCEEGEALVFVLGKFTEKKRILDAVEILYPTCWQLTLTLIESDD